MITLRGSAIVSGKAVGPALVSRDRLSVNLGVDEKTGLVVERHHDLEGQSIAGKVLVFPGEKGSGSSSLSLYQLVSQGLGPVAIINLQAGAILAAGAALSNIPLMHRFDADPLTAIENGDLVSIDADSGVVTVQKAGAAREA